jgi:multidrug efflux system outer membrane protein
MRTMTRPGFATALVATVAGSLVGVLAGCAAQPLPTLDRSVPAAWRHAPSPAAAAPDLKGWWRGFDDAALDALVDRALAENLGLRAAAERLLAARVLRAHARDAYLPYVRAHTDEEFAPSASASYLVSSIDALWELGLFGRREGTSRMLQAEADDSDAVQAGAQVSLIAEVVADYLLLGAAQERLALLARARTLNEQQQSLLSVREGLGLASPIEVAEADAALSRARAAEASGHQQVDAMAAQLAVLLGRVAPEPAWLDGAHLAHLKVDGIAAAPAELLRTRPEIRRAEAAVLAAAGAADLARADRLPDVGIGGSMRWSTNVSRNRGRASTFAIASFAPLIDIPLFDWGQRRARADSKFHLLSAATLDYREAVLRGVAEVETALGTLQRDTLRETEAEHAAEALQRGADATTRRTQLQLASPLTTTAATLAAVEAQLALLDARTERGMAYVALYKALGGAPRPATDAPAGGTP